MFNPWLGQFVVIKRVDNDSYLISPKDDRRKTYLVYRGRLRPLGQPADSPVILDKNDAHMDKKSISGNDSLVESKTKVEPNVNTKKYGLRKRSDIDYRKFY